MLTTERLAFRLTDSFSCVAGDQEGEYTDQHIYCLRAVGPSDPTQSEMNRWNIPDWLEREVKNRDSSCVYCRVKFGSSEETRGSRATWEHIVNDAKLVNRENIARCCFSCNSSKGTKKLSDWLESDYCRTRGITKDTVAQVVRRALAVPQKVRD